MKRKAALWVACLSFAAVGYAQPTAGSIKSPDKSLKAQRSGQTDRPNVVLILADDLGFGDLGAYGATRIKTPVIDQLASEGIRFTDAHSASSLCSPSRYAVLTGRYPWRTRLKRGVVATFDKPLIDSGRVTIASVFKQAGYYTAAIGKWHLGFDWTMKPGKKIGRKQKWAVAANNKVDFEGPVTGGPNAVGFDYYYGIPGSLNMMPYVILENERVTQVPTVVKTWYDSDFPGAKRAPNWNSTQMGAKLTERAVSVIHQHFDQASDQPLFLFFPTAAIHRPALPNFTKDASQAGLRGDMVQQLDWTVGEVVKALKKEGQLENTLIIITSDNGPRPGDPDTWFKQLKKRYYGDSLLPASYLAKTFKPQDSFHKPDYGGPWMTYDHKASGDLLGFKEDPWEGGHRVPFIVYWPAKIKHPAVSGQMLCLSDLLASFSHLTGQSLPDSAGEDSEDMLTAFEGKHTGMLRKYMVNVSGVGEFTIRMGKWKLIDTDSLAKQDTHYPQKIGVGPQLYDLSKDLEEKNNVFAQHPDIVQQMRAVLKKYRTSGFSASRLENSKPKTSRLKASR